MRHSVLERVEFPFHAWTDYPLFEREYGKDAPIRRVSVVSYDGNKYCMIKYKGKKHEVKAGYIYPYPSHAAEQQTKG